MNFNRHYELEGKHASFSASSPYWIKYDTEKALQVYRNQQAKYRGTLLHQFASDAIEYGIALKEDEGTISQYVNDCINDRMSSEVVLFYSKNFFGTADAISFEDGVLKIYDLKTGRTVASMNQLLVYAALFCLEYQYNPIDILIHLRIYQNDTITVHDADPDEVWDIIDHIIAIDDAIQSVNEKGRRL